MPMALRSMWLPPDPAPLPAATAALLADARGRIDRWFAQPGRIAGQGSIPSDHELVYRALRTLRREQPELRSFLEWGSGFGVVTALAAQLGFGAHGIEYDAALVAGAHDLLTAHGVRASFVVGSFVPPGSDARLDAAELETRTVLRSDDAYDRLERDLDDFEVVFAYPWPDEEGLYRRLFAQHADFGAVLVTYSRLEGVRAYRKVAGKGRAG